MISHYVKPGAGRFLDYLLLEHWVFAIHDIDDEKKAWSVIITQFMLHKRLLVREIVILIRTRLGSELNLKMQQPTVNVNCALNIAAHTLLSRLPPSYHRIILLKPFIRYPEMRCLVG